MLSSPHHNLEHWTDAEAEASILWPPDVKNWLTGKDPDAGKDWRREEKETTEDEMVGWHHWLNGHEFEQAPGVGNGTGKPGVLQSMGSQRVGHNWVTELILISLPEKNSKPISSHYLLYPIRSLLRESLICINTRGHMWEWHLREATRPNWVICFAIQLFVTKRAVSLSMLST